MEIEELGSIIQEPIPKTEGALTTYLSRILTVTESTEGNNETDRQQNSTEGTTAEGKRAGGNKEADNGSEVSTPDIVVKPEFTKKSKTG